MATDESDIKSVFKKKYFWDTDLASLDPDESRRLIIDRVFSMGSVEDVREVINYYGQEGVVEVLCDLPYLDPKTLNFVSVIFNIPREQFKCHQRRQSTEKQES
jgi:GTP:adenosylcobinamide-phosphate guanylyltransferase